MDKIMLPIIAQVPGCTGDCTIPLPHVSADQGSVTIALQLIFGVVGAVAVVYIVYQAIHFAHSQGDPQTIAKARMGIVYAVIGLAIAISAEVIVTFVLGAL